jgi:hypothetical protein
VPLLSVGAGGGEAGVLANLRLRWRSNGKDELTLAAGAAGALLLTSSKTVATGAQSPTGRELLELDLEGFVDGQSARVYGARWHAGDPAGAVTIGLDVTVFSSSASGVVTRSFAVSREWGGVTVEVA